jgi:hypothetical protein
MVDVPRSSFIPRDSGMTPGTVRKKHTYHVFSIVGNALLIGSLVLAGVAFYFKLAEERTFTEVRKSLVERKDAIDEAQVSELRTFEQQITAAQMLLNSHMSPVRLLNALETNTSRNVRVVSLTFDHVPHTQVLVTVEGETIEFSTLALQKDQLARDAMLANMSIEAVAMPDSEQSTTSVNGIRFTLKGEVDRARMEYDGGTYYIPPSPIVSNPPTAEGGAPSTAERTPVRSGGGSTSGSVTLPATISEPPV